MSSPSRRQYLEIKARHPDALLMYQVGDFFEFFDEDARVAARALRIVLTSRSFGEGERSPLCGVPLHALESYAGKLVAQGFKVAICEQIEPPGKGLVRREVTRVLTPGTIVETGLLPPERDNYLAAVAVGHRGRGGVGLAWVEASTGTFRCAEWSAPGGLDAFRAELERLRPAEVLVVEASARPGQHAELENYLPAPLEALCLTRCPPHYFDRESARVRLCRHFGAATLDAYGCGRLDLATSAAGAILAFLERMHPALLRLITDLATYQTDGYVEVDARTWAALEVMAPARRSPGGPTLLRTLDATRTPMGARLLRRTLSRPLRDRTALEARLDAVAALHADAGARQRLAAALDGLPDVERLAGRVAQGRAETRELRALAAGLAGGRAVRAALGGVAAGDLADAVARLDSCAEVTRLIEEAVVPPGAGDGRLLRRGYNADLDALEDSVAESRHWLADLERVERERTGIRSLRVTYTKVFGYAIEVTRPNLSRVPPDYQRRQTIATGERFMTAELREHEARVLQAEERITALERTLYAELLARLAAHLVRMRGTSAALAAVDVRLALATVAVARAFVRPTLADDTALEIHGGRHPVVEAALDGGHFIPNDTLLGPSLAEREAGVMREAGMDGSHAPSEASADAQAACADGRAQAACADGRAKAACTDGRAQEADGAASSHGDGGRVLVLTGPNMAGKSTYLRQVAEIVLLAQIGSFVPADWARIGLVDRLFARVGADDDLAHGISTFMGEMAETAYILGHATERSLVILDEVGRGTSTADGLAIARAVVEYLHDRVGARTLFATHFQELADLADTLPALRLAAMDVRELDGEVVFLHQIRPGRAAMSYGVHVARMAGLPRTVTDRAAALLEAERIEASAPMTAPSAVAKRAPDETGRGAMMIPRATPGAASVRDSSPWSDREGAASREVVLGLASLNVAAMTPMEAINVLFALQQRAVSALRAGTS